MISDKQRQMIVDKQCQILFTTCALAKRQCQPCSLNAHIDCTR